MEYSERLRSSFVAIGRSPSLLAVMLLEFIARMVLVVLFAILDLAVLGYINKDVLSAMTPDTMSWAPLLNPTTIIVGVLLLVVQMLILLYIHSFFASGFFGMVKNYVKDGSTVFAEFMPGVRRYWRATFRFLFVRYGVMLLLSIPFGIALFNVLGTQPGFVTNTQWGLFIGASIFTIITGILLFFWLFFGEAAIVFEDLEAWEAVKRSGSIASKRIGLVIGGLVTIFVIVLIASFIVTILTLPFDVKIESLRAVGDTAAMSGWMMARDIVNFILNVVTIVANIIVVVFIFLTFNDAVGGRPAARPVVATKRSDAIDERSIPKTVIKRKTVSVKPAHKPLHKTSKRR